MITEAITAQGLPMPLRALPTLCVTHLWLFDTEFDLRATVSIDDPRALLLAAAAAACAPASGNGGGHRSSGLGDGVELALARMATELGVLAPPARGVVRRAMFLGDTTSPCVTSIDDGRHGVTVTRTGTVAAVLPHCTGFLDDQGREVPLTRQARAMLHRAGHLHTAHGRRVLAVGHRAVGAGRPAPADRSTAETELVLLGLIAMTDLPRALRTPDLRNAG